MDWNHAPVGPDTGTAPDGDLDMTGIGFDDDTIMHIGDDQVLTLDDDSATLTMAEPPSRSMPMPHAPPNGGPSRESYPYNFNLRTSSASEGIPGVPGQETRAASEPPSSGCAGVRTSAAHRRFERKPAAHAGKSAGVQKKPRNPSDRHIIKNQDGKLAFALEQFHLAKDDDEPKQGYDNNPQGDRIEHPLRRLLLNLRGFAFGTDLDAVRFPKAGCVIAGVEEFLPAAGGGNLYAALQWLVRFLLLAFRTRKDLLRRRPGCRDVDEIEGGYALVAMEVRQVLKKYNDGPAGPREKMEMRLARGAELRDLVRWTALARRRFLTEGEGARPAEEIPGFAGFGARAREVKPSMSETLLLALIDEDNAAIWTGMGVADVFMGFEKLTLEESSK